MSNGKIYKSIYLYIYLGVAVLRSLLSVKRETDENQKISGIPELFFFWGGRLADCQSRSSLQILTQLLRMCASE